jgi:hypothetical protein
VFEQRLVAIFAHLPMLARSDFVYGLVEFGHDVEAVQNMDGLSRFLFDDLRYRIATYLSKPISAAGCAPCRKSGRNAVAKIRCLVRSYTRLGIGWSCFRAVGQGCSLTPPFPRPNLPTTLA